MIRYGCPKVAHGTSRTLPIAGHSTQSVITVRAIVGENTEDRPLSEEQASREAWFDSKIARSHARAQSLPLRCPCCGCKTLAERAIYEIFEVCFWEDDGQDEIDADENRGGPNWALSLSQARANYLRFGACKESMLTNVRPPRPEELP